MAITTRSPRCPAVALGAVALAALMVLAGCSSSKGDAAAGTTTSSSGATSTSSSPGSTGTTGGGTGTTVSGGSGVGSASTLPASVAGTCGALAETYGLDQIQPKNTSSWIDERQRLVVDAQREGALLTTAQQGAPAPVAAQLATMADYASWLATTMQGAGSFSEAVAAVDAYPQLVTVSLAVAGVQTWQKANCPD